MNRVQSIAFVIHPHKPGAMELGAKLSSRAEKLGVSPKTLTEHPLPIGCLEDIDLCMVIGGDGTILGVVPEATRTKTPILGINLGKLGFLATFTPEEISERIEKVIDGQFETDQRSLINCCSNNGEQFLALNDVVIKSTTINLISLQVTQDERRVADYSCDGLIFATPTGSSAYNLSAGGPILHPKNHSIAMTPICPHTLSNRSFIFPDSVKLKINCDVEKFSANISIDGRPLTQNGPLFPFNIALAKNRITLVHDQKYSHYRMLRSKLNWV